MLSILDRIGRFSLFAAHVAWVVPRSLLRPSLILIQLARFTIGSLPVVLIIGFSLGLVTWMHLGQLLARFESQTLLPSVLMVAVVLEFGPVSVGLLAASRLAAGLAAELSAMNTSEQIDALRSQGVDPYVRLFAPRVIACALVLPPLAIIVDYSALLGSYLAEMLGGDLSWTLYRESAIEHLSVLEAALATAKTIVFGLLVSLISCWQGIQAERSTEAVGQAATHAVVLSTVAVLVSNVFLVRLIQIATQ